MQNNQNLPFTITPHHIWGYDAKAWLLIEIPLLIASFLLFFFVEAMQLYSYLWFLLPVGVVAVHALHAYMSRGLALTLKVDGIEIKTPQATTFVPFEKLQPVTAGITSIGGSAYMIMQFISPELNVKFSPTTLYWGKKDFKHFYEMIPAQYRADATWQNKQIIR